MNYTISDNRVPLKVGDIVEVSPHKRYIIDKHVASGGFALMYIGHEENNSGVRYVALKELFPRNLDNALVQRMDDGKILAWNPFALDAKGEDEALYAELNQYFQREVELTHKAGSVYTADGQVAQQNNLDVLNVEGPFTDIKGNVYLAIDTYMGEPLRNLIERGFVKNREGKVRSNQYISEIIDVLIETTIRLSSLHDGASMYHLDISPDNIYLAHSAGRTRYQPFIIDYGSAYDRDNPTEQVDHRYTWNPFSSPEVIRLAELGSDCELRVDESCDTYSVTAILFYALTGCTFSSEMRFFDDGWKEQIHQAYSLGISSSPSKPSFASDLITFLERGLATSQNNRYRTAKELLQALQALKMSYRAYGNLLPLVEPDELMSYLVLQKHPLYEYKSDDGDIHVLCLGSGCFIKRMILSLISTGQMIDSHLHIHIVSKETEQVIKADICASAPSLLEYSNLASSCDSSKEYVTFSFDTVENVLQEDVCKAIVDKHRKARYYLISLGKNKQNYDAANLYAKTLSRLCVEHNSKTIINYYCSEDAANNGVYSSYIQDSPAGVKIDAFADNLSSYSQTIRELGIRTLKLSHLYNKLSNASATIKETAESLVGDRYGQRSSCASALHINYKLSSVGIELRDTTDPEVVIEAYQEALRNDTFGRLLELEHRRWMMFMIADGYCQPTDSELSQYGFELVDGKFNATWKCSSKKLHPCLVPCAPNGIVLTNSQWDMIFKSEKNIQDITKAIGEADFDPLDKMSLHLHLLSLKKCRNILNSQRLEHLFGYIADKLHTGIAVGSDTVDTDLEILEKALNSTQGYILTVAHNLTYSGDDRYLGKLKELFNASSINIENEVQQLQQLLQVFVEYASWRDYKAPDATIINNLMWIVFSESDFDLVKLQGNAIVDNIASVLMLEPRSLVYLGTENHPEWTSFLRKHKYSGAVEFIDVGCLQPRTIEAKLNAVVNASHRKCVIDISGADEAMIVAAQRISEKFDNVSLIRSKSDATLENIYNFPTALAYSLAPSLSAEDVFMLHGATEQLKECNYMDRLIDFAPLLWKLYREFQDDWEMITAFFAHPRCSGSGMWVRNFRVGPNTLWKPYYRDNIPKEKWTRLQIESVFSELEKAGFIRNVVFGGNRSGKTVAFEYPTNSDDPKTDFIRKTFNNFFGVKIPAASSPFTCTIAYSEESGFFVDVKSESIVDCFCKKDDFSDKRQREAGLEKRFTYAKIEPVLRRMEKMGLISKLSIILSEDPVSTDIKFTYADVSVRQCLVTAGNVLELYVWYHARQMRVFDDCATNFTFKWREGIQNELDVILTVGLTTLVISCKTAKFKKEHLYEIKYLTEKFSVNSLPVIVYSSKLAVEDGLLSANLRPVKDRAKAMGIYLIDLNELNMPLGEKLVRIANGHDLP